jgi:hypothetical protein
MNTERRQAVLEHYLTHSQTAGVSGRDLGGSYHILSFSHTHRRPSAGFSLSGTEGVGPMDKPLSAEPRVVIRQSAESLAVKLARIKVMVGERQVRW